MKLNLRWLAMTSMTALMLLGSACSKEETAESSITGSDTLNLSFEEMKNEAKDKEVRLFMWGGDEGINRYIDEWVAPRLKEQHSVELKRYPMDAAEFVNKLLLEKESGDNSGDMDIIWLNGKNFKAAKENDLLLGPITPHLPSFQQYVDKDSPDVQLDFGYPTEGYEAPWGRVQFVFAYRSDKVENPPRSMEELLAWVKENPGKFTYPAPPDFTGSAFVRHVLYDTSPPEDHAEYVKPFDEKAMGIHGERVWDYLNEIKPYLWREGKSYPQSLAQLEQLYQNGELWFTMGYDEANASAHIASGQFPETTKTFVLDKGTLANTHFLAVPFNSPNPAGALVTINELLSPEAQLKKMELTYWGENTSLDVTRLPEENQKQMKNIDRGPATLPEEVLAKHRLPEVSGEYVEWLDRGWIKNIAQ
jgi:putative spermidine/putrescine transport system substrate-binding protein